jgi:parvulin-like peptidyl-prolyl isomerase
MRRITALCALVMGVLVACGSSAATPTPSPAVARVATQVITQAAFDVRLQSAFTSIQQGGGPTSDPVMRTHVRASVLRSLILDTIIGIEANSRGIAANDAQVKAEVDADAQSVGGMSELGSQLAAAGGSLAQLQDSIRSRLNEQRLEDQFAQHRAAEVLQQLAGGADFATTAGQFSDDTGTNTKGGDLGAMSDADLTAGDAAFAAAVRALAVGEYSRTPVHDTGGYDIIKLDAKTATSWSVRHILVSAPVPYTVQNRPTWFAAALFSAVAQYCQQGEIHVYISDAGANPCTGAPSVPASASPSPGG